jgi:tRNA G18 (ribose-2'-O)-methylase SpoU
VSVINFKEKKQQLIDQQNRGDNVHDHLKNYSIEVRKSIAAADRLNFSVCCLNLIGDLNIGTVVRTAHLMGAEKVYLFGRRSFDSRGTVGAMHYTDVERIEGLTPEGEIDCEKFLKIFEPKGTLLFIEQNDYDNDLNDMWKVIRQRNEQNRHHIIVLGSESDGIPPIIMHGKGTVFSIRQRGVIRSLNVSTAAGIAMYTYVNGIETP